jgi:hypothetical protein
MFPNHDLVDRLASSLQKLCKVIAKYLGMYLMGLFMAYLGVFGDETTKHTLGISLRLKLIVSIGVNTGFQ